MVMESSEGGVQTDASAREQSAVRLSLNEVHRMPEEAARPSRPYRSVGRSRHYYRKHHEIVATAWLKARQAADGHACGAEIHIAGQLLYPHDRYPDDVGTRLGRMVEEEVLLPLFAGRIKVVARTIPLDPEGNELELAAVSSSLTVSNMSVMLGVMSRMEQRKRQGAEGDQIAEQHKLPGSLPTAQTDLLTAFEQLVERYDAISLSDRAAVLVEVITPITRDLVKMARRLVEGDDPEVARVALHFLAEICDIASAPSERLLAAPAAAQFLNKSLTLIKTLAGKNRLGALLGDEYRFPWAELVAFKSIDRPTGRHLKP
jgi:hypothetical protein